MDSYFIVHTPRGYVGRSTTRGLLVDTMPHSFAYCYDTAEDAAHVAMLFANATITEVRTR